MRRRKPEDRQGKTGLREALSNGGGSIGCGCKDHRRPSRRFPITSGSRNALELDLRRFAYGFAFVAEVEKFLRGEAKRGRKERRRKPLRRGVVFLDGVVEEPPGCGDLILDVRELGLQLLKVGVGLQIRV